MNTTPPHQLALERITVSNITPIQSITTIAHIATICIAIYLVYKRKYQMKDKIKELWFKLTHKQIAKIELRAYDTGDKDKIAYNARVMGMRKELVLMLANAFDNDGDLLAIFMDASMVVVGSKLSEKESELRDEKLLKKAAKVAKKASAVVN